MVVSAEFASVLDGCSYVEPVVVSNHFTDYTPAVEQAKLMFSRVLISKVQEKAIGVTTQCESFNQEAWRQMGMLNEWFRLPLVFDRREHLREYRLVEEMPKRAYPDQPIVLINLDGKSAPYPYRKELLHELRKVRVFDIGKVQAHRIYDLIGLFDAATMLVTADTSTMHLSAASGIPVVNLIGDKPTRWHGSRPRNNDVLSIRYSDVHRLKEIANVGMPWKSRTWHVWSDYLMQGEALHRHNVAKLSWKATGWIPFPVTENRRVMNDPMRSVPFIKDLIGAALQAAGPKDVIVLTNADTCVSTDAAERVAKAIGLAECCYSFRRDFPSLTHPLTREQIREGRFYQGCDLFAFTVGWWHRHGAAYPDVCLGAEGWDWAMRVLMKRHGGAEFDDLIAHSSHPNTWETPENRTTLPSQLHNRRLTSQFLALNGVSA